MAKRRSEVVAASLLSAWTDADTAMQIVGTSLGVFGAESFEPTTVLSRETPLRNALFDVLLSLVEGGALELRVAPDNRYAFRWRTDIAVAGLAPDGATIDIAVPSPYVAELQHAQAERDRALARAESAEALAAEREHLLSLADRQAPAEPASADPVPPAVEPLPAPDTPVAAPDTRKPAAKRAPAKKPAPPRPVAAKPAAQKPAAQKPAAQKPAAQKPAAQKPAAQKPAAQKQARKPARAKAAAKKAAAVAPEPDIDLTSAENRAVDDISAARSRSARRPKWSGYTIDRSRSHLSSVDRLVEDG